MKRLLVLVISIFFTSTAFSQTCISGTVTSTSGDTLTGVNVYVKGTLDGGTSSANGYYSFTTVVTGKQNLVASMVGMELFTQEIMANGNTVVMNIRMREKINELNAVTITAGSFETGDVKKAAVLNSLDIVTTAGATADIYGALQTLPGVLPSMESSGLLVRGGDTQESKLFFDGILVNKPFTSELPDISQRGRFSPFLFKGTSFSTGAYSSLFGGALSSTVQMESHDVAKKNKSEIGIMSVGLNAGHAQRFQKSSLELNGSYYNLRPAFSVMKQHTKWDHEPESFQGSAFYKLKTGETGIFKLYACFERSHTGLTTFNRDDISKDVSYDIKSDNIYLNATWSQFISKNWKIFAGAGYGDDKSQIGFQNDDAVRHDKSFHGRYVVTRYLGKISDVKTGVDYFHIKAGESFRSLDRENEIPLVAAFAEGNLHIHNAIAIRPGFRYEYSSFAQAGNMAPRLSVALRISEEAQVSAGVGRYHQLPGNEYLYGDTRPGFENATHYVFNYQYLKNNRTFRAEVYYKDYDNLVTINPETGNEGYGYAKGIDLFYRDTKTVKRTDFWISYSYLETKRKFRDYPTAATPSFASPHVGNVVGKYFISRWSTSVGATYTFAAGRTYYNPNNPEFLGDKTKPYHNFSINVSHLTHLAGRFTILYLSFENVFGISNIYGYRYSADGTFRKAIVPSAPRSVFIGVFVTLKGDGNDGI